MAWFFLLLQRSYFSQSSLWQHVISGNCFSCIVICVFSQEEVLFHTKHYSFTFFRQMELNPCENGSIKAENNQQEQTLIKSLACLNLETNERSSDVSVEDHTEEGSAGKYAYHLLSSIVILLV